MNFVDTKSTYLTSQKKAKHLLLNHVVTESLEGMPARRGLVGEVCQGVGVGLRVVEVIHTGQLPPADITPHLYQDYYYYHDNCQARVQVPNSLSQQAPNPDPKVRPSLKNPKTQFFGLGLTQ